MRQAIFLDRDGTIIEDRGHLSDPSQVVFFEESFDALRRLGGHFALLIVTNQPGLAEGALQQSHVDSVNAFVVDQLARAGVNIEGVYVCPHRRSDNCLCIKPKPHFLRQAADEHGLDLSRSYVVGDHPHDVELASNVGAKGVYVLTGHGRMHRQQVPPGTVIAEGISQAVEWILGDSKARRRRL